MLLRSSHLHAQAPVELGAYGGFTSSRPLTYTCVDLLLGDPCSPGTSEPHYSEAGFTLGAYVRFPLHSIVLAEADLLYSQKGENHGPNGTHTTHHYIELPLLAEIDPTRGKSPVRVFMLGGLSPAIRVGCTATGVIFDNDAHMAVDYSGSCEDLPAPLGERTPKRFDLGVVAGAGLGWKSPYGTLEVQVRYVRGLVDTTDDATKTINRAAFLMAGFGIDVGHP